MKKPNILSMDADDLLNLRPHEICWILSSEEILHIFRTLNGFWSYDYEAAKAGKVGLHAKLKSERCSDGFFYSKIVLRHANLRRIIAKTLAMAYADSRRKKPGLVGGIPDGAYELGHDVADYLGVPVLEMEKKDGVIRISGLVDSQSEILLVEDFCTRGTGFMEMVRQIRLLEPGAKFVPMELVILNRGGLDLIDVDGDKFVIKAAVEHRINDWDPAECPLHKLGSESIKPKATEENWKLITSSQQEFGKEDSLDDLDAPETGESGD